MNTEQLSYWEDLLKEIEPMMHVGETLLERTLGIVDKYHVDLTSEVNWEKLPESFKDELQSCVSSEMNVIPCGRLLNEFLHSDCLFQKLVDMIEMQYYQLERDDTSTRSFLQYLMQEVMNTSITLNEMNIEDWHKIIKNKKEACQVDDITEHAYKKLSILLKGDVCIYDFFYNKTKPGDIDKLLSEAKDSLLLAFTYRGLTKKRGQGMSRFIVDYICRWQNEGLMKPLRNVFPFCHCLQQYWNNEVNLGTRQGLEAIYKQTL